MTTERLRRERKIKAGALQDAIFNSAYFSSIATDEMGVIQIFNVGAERMLGYSAEDVVNRITPADISDPKELVMRAAELSAELDEVITPGFEALVFKASRGIEDMYELTYIRKDGSRFPAIVSVTALRDANEGIIGYLLIGTDNTAHKRIEAAQALLDQRLREQQFYTRSLIESNIDALMMTDPLGTISDVNEQMTTLTGRTREELIGSPCRNFFTDPVRADAAIHRVLSEQRVSNYELTVRAKDGVETIVSYNAATFYDADDKLQGVFAAARDATERKRFERTLQEKNVQLEHASRMKSEFFATMSHEMRTRLHHLAHYDELTGLPNRTLFRETLQRTLVQAVDSGWTVAVMFVDVDRFKDVNDKFGHDVGDELLRQVSARLARCVRVRDTVGRLGGDEFALILAMQDGQRGAAAAAHKIRTNLRAPFELAGHVVEASVSIGITVCPDDAADPETLVKYADTAMYRAKEAGGNTFRFFTTQMNTDVVERLDLEAALRDAVHNEEFVLHYQPKMHVETGRVAGVEALLRWNRPGHGLMMPNAFIPALEETGLIVEVGNWVIATACQQIGRWSRSAVGPLQVSVNVSGRQLLEGRIDEVIARALRSNDIPGELLEVELTESTLMANTDHTISTLRALRARGVEISIDDFGTGFSSLAYLCRFPVDKLKIDIAFIRNVTTSEDDAAIASAIILMAHGLKMQVVAEGVETADQLEHLRLQHCDQIQGYHFSRPLTVGQVEDMLELQPWSPAPAEPVLTRA